MDQQFKKFIKFFKKLHVYISFVDALQQIPTYAKFLKKILTNKEKSITLRQCAIAEQKNAQFFCKISCHQN